MLHPVQKVWRLTPEKKPFFVTKFLKRLLPFHSLLNYAFFGLCAFTLLTYIENIFLDPYYEPVPFEALQIPDFSFNEDYGAMEFSWANYGGDKIAGVSLYAIIYIPAT